MVVTSETVSAKALTSTPLTLQLILGLGSTALLNMYSLCANASSLKSVSSNGLIVGTCTVAVNGSLNVGGGSWVDLPTPDGSLKMSVHGSLHQLGWVVLQLGVVHLYLYNFPLP